MMRLKVTAAALLLTLLPGAVLAEGCGWGHSKDSASQCPEGYVLDNSTGGCVKQTMS